MSTSPSTSTPQLAVDVDELDAELTRRSLAVFLRGQIAIDPRAPADHWNVGAWSILEPGTDLRFTWNVEAICEHLDALRLGTIRRLLITTPPRSTKSTTVSKAFPAHWWLTDPSVQFLTASHQWNLASRDSSASKILIRHDWYERLNRRADGSPIFRMADRGERALMDLKDREDWYQNNRGGHRKAVGFDTGITGHGGSCIIVDDAHDAEKVESEAERSRTLRRFRKVLLNRLNNAKEGRILVIGQRVHEQDVPGYCQESGYEELCIRTEYELADAKRKTSIGWTDPRTEPGELIDPERFGPEEVAQAKIDLGSYGYAAQHQQRPAPAGGGIFQSRWWREFDVWPTPSMFTTLLASWDLRFSGDQEGSRTAGVVIGVRGSDRYILEGAAGLWSVLEEYAQFHGFRRRWPGITGHLVENKADGAALISMVRKKVPGVIPVNPVGDKPTRARATSPIHEAGNIWLPSERLVRERGLAWVHDWRAEHEGFPKGKANDYVDATSQGLAYLARLERSTGGKPPPSPAGVRAVTRA